MQIACMGIEVPLQCCSLRCIPILFGDHTITSKSKESGLKKKWNWTTFFHWSTMFIMSPHCFKFNSKCCDFCKQCSNSIKVVGKFKFFLLICVVKFSNQPKMYLFFVSQSKFRLRFTWVHQTTFDGCNFGGLYLFHLIFVFNKICKVIFPLKSS